MDSKKTSFDDLRAKVFEAGKKARAEGYVPPDGTYTFNNQEASAISMSLAIVASLLHRDSAGATLGLAVLAQFEPEVSTILERISDEIMNKQCPTFINKAVDEFHTQRRNTDKRLS